MVHCYLEIVVGKAQGCIELSPDGEITFIPRVQGQRIMMPMDVGDKREGEEVLSLSLDEALQLMAADKLVWTARDHGPYRRRRPHSGAGLANPSRCA